VTTPDTGVDANHPALRQRKGQKLVILHYRSVNLSMTVQRRIRSRNDDSESIASIDRYKPPAKLSEVLDNLQNS
jgi:hypothetical protein